MLAYKWQGRDLQRECFAITEVKRLQADTMSLAVQYTKEMKTTDHPVMEHRNIYRAPQSYTSIIILFTYST